MIEQYRTAIYLHTKWHLDPSSSLSITTDRGENLGAVPLLGRGLGLHLIEYVAGAEAYLHTEFHLDPSNRLVAIHQRYRQTNREDNGPTA